MSAPYDPVLYALVHQGTPGDLELYLAACAGAKRVLELGSGYGRVSLALAEQGSSVWGVELDPGLLALAEARRAELPPEIARHVHFQRGDMRAPDVAGPFDRVIIPFSGLYCLQSDDEVVACLSAARALLTDEGALIFDGYAADGFHHECLPEDYPDDKLDHVALIAANGVVYDVYERSSWDRDAQRMVATYVHRPDGGGADIEHQIAQRYLLASQLEPLLTQSGLGLSELRGSFDGAAYDEDSEVMVVVARPLSR